MSWDFTVYCKRTSFRREKLDAVCEKLGGAPDEEEYDDDDDGEATYRFDGFTLRVFANPAGCTVQVWSQDGFDDDATDTAAAYMEELADALGGSVEEEEWLERSAAIDAKNAKKRAKNEGWLLTKGQPNTARFLLYDETGTLIAKKVLTAGALFAHKPESRILTALGRKQDGIRKMEVIDHDGSGNPDRRVVMTYDAEGVEIARDDSGYIAH